MKNKQMLNERKQFMKIAGLLKEDQEFDSYEDLVTAVNEILADYGNPEGNLRSSSSVEKGVKLIREYVEGYSSGAGENKYDVYRDLYKDVIGDYIESKEWLDAYDEEDEEDYEAAQAQLARDIAMFNAAALDMSYSEYLNEFGDKYLDALKLDSHDSYFNSLLKRKAGNVSEGSTPNDYNPGTPSGDTNAMNIGEAGKIPYSYSHVDDLEDAIKVVEGVHEYVKRFADTDDEGGMNEAGDLLPGLEDLKWFLIGLQKKGQNG